MAKLNQIIAIEKGVKARSQSALTELYKTVQKPDLFNGFSRSYHKVSEDGEDLPPESKRVQQNAGEILANVETVMTDLMDLTFRKDHTNCHARADLVVADVTIARDVPVTFLLSLEKQLIDIRTLVATLPELDPSESWMRDANTGLYRSATISTHRTKKVQKPIVLYPATPEHPAQTQMVTEDVIVGHWSATKTSGAVPGTTKQELAARVEKLIRAVKQAREAANMQEELGVAKIGDALFTYLFDR